MGTHESLRPYVKNPDDLYEVLKALQASGQTRLGWRMIALVALLAVGLIVAGAVGKAALCLAALVGLACVGSLVDHVARDNLMHLVTLHDLIRPKYDSADIVMADWLKATGTEQPDSADPK